MTDFVARLRGRQLAVARGQPERVSTAGLQVLLAGQLAVTPAQRRGWGLAADSSAARCLASAWRRHGWDMVRQLGGAWCALLLDEASGDAVLLHDALGVHELFHARQGEDLLVASSLAGLLAVDARRVVDEDYLGEVLADIDDHRGKTAWRHIRRLGQGAGGLWRAGRLAEQRVYAPRVRAEPVRPADEARVTAELAEGLRDQMVEAVRASLPERGTLWCELSGGLDSSSVLAITHRVLGRTTETFSVVYGRSQASDERPWMDRMHQACPVPTHRLDADAFAPFSTVPDHFLPEPTGHALVCAFDQARARLLAEAGVAAVLTGMCGDAVFLGDGPRPDHLADIRQPLRLWRELRRWADESPEQRPWTYWLQLHVLRPRLGRSAPRAAQPPPWLSPRHRQALAAMGSAGTGRAQATGPAREGPSGLGHGDAWYWQRVLKAARLARGGQAHIGPSGLFRNPWLHLPLVEFIAAAPWPAKLQPGHDRALQRQAMAGLLPEAVRTRTDKGTPTQALLDGLHDSQPWGDWLTRDAWLLRRGDVEPGPWLQAVHLARHGICTHPGGFLQACMLEAWWRCLRHAPAVDKAACAAAWRPVDTVAGPR